MADFETRGTRPRVRRVVAWVATLAVLVSGLVVMTPPVAAEAANGADFDPGYIISDANFYNGNAMTQAQIQAFLEAVQPGTCVNSNCLKLLQVDTVDKAAYYSSSSGQVECQPYPGALGELASTIIFKVQQICGISAKVILVTLQKEQGLILKLGPTTETLKRAMGMGCPDTSGGTCAAEYDGFFNQVYWGTRQMKTYRAAPTYFNFRAGRTSNIQYKPNTTCGTQSVYVANYATAALYNYTPYVPNAAALANLGGLGDGCSSYGNRNFWVFYNNWFGSPTGPINPVGYLEGVSSPAASTVRVVGWAFDYDTPDSIKVHAYANGSFVAEFAANLARPDVNAAYPGMSGNHGFNTTLTVAPGTRNICLYAINVKYGSINTPIGCRTVTIAKPPPVEPAATELGAVYRFWSDTYQGHFYTRSVAERNSLIVNYPDSVWKYEGAKFGAYGAPVVGTIPVYRFWSGTYKGHFYTTSEAEKNQVIADYPAHIWKYEAVAFYVYPSSSTNPDTVPMARFWSPTYLHHFYTADAAEAKQVSDQYPDQIWTPEGNVFRVPIAVPSAAPLP